MLSSGVGIGGCAGAGDCGVGCSQAPLHSDRLIRAVGALFPRDPFWAEWAHRRTAVPVREPSKGTPLINGCAGAIASRTPCPELCPGTGASCGALPWRPDLLVGRTLTRDR